MDARPDQEEMEEAINSFLQQLDKQEKQGFKDLAESAVYLMLLATSTRLTRRSCVIATSMWPARLEFTTPRSLPC